MFNSQLAGQQILIENATLEIVETYTYLGHTISANQPHEKGTRRIRMG